MVWPRVTGLTIVDLSNWLKVNYCIELLDFRSRNGMLQRS